MSSPSTPHGGAARETPFNCASLLAPLLRYAKSRVRNPTLAEDAVSETLLATLESGQNFLSPAQATAWMYGVLRHKLVDQLRRQGRETPAGDMACESLDEHPDWIGAGAWTGGQDPWSLPEQACSQRQFLTLVARCCEDLPRLQRQAFLMRELWGVEPAVVCRELEVTEGHLWVLVHRARLRLRESVRRGWVLPTAPGPTTCSRSA